MQVLELVGKETMDLLIAETGIEVEKSTMDAERKIDEDQLFEEVAFDRYFYIYGGPEQLEVTCLYFKLRFSFVLLIMVVINFHCYHDVGIGGIVQSLCSGI